MPKILGVALGSAEVVFFRFVVERDETPEIEKILRVKRSEFAPKSSDDLEVEINGGQPDINVPEEVRGFLESEYFEAVATFEPKTLISERASFPFKDLNKIKSVASLELEELLPFPLDGFLLETLMVGENEEKQTSVLLVAVPESEFVAELQFLKHLGIDPSVLTPSVCGLAAASSLLALPSAAVVSLSAGYFSFSSLKNGCPQILRSFAVNSQESALHEVLPTLLSACRSENTVPEIFYSTSGQLSLPLNGIRTEFLDLNTLGVRNPLNEDDESIVIATLGAAVARVQKRPMINFRSGRHRYRGGYKQFLSPILEQRIYLGAFALWLLLWAGSLMYADNSKIGLVNYRIEQAVRGVFPGELIPAGDELQFAQAKVGELEQKMKGLGSISSLSPLEALKELSEVVLPSVDLAIDTLQINQSGVTFNGSVANNGMVGRLFGVLEKKKDRFCGVKVDPRGTMSGSSRFRVVAELKYCL